MKRFLLYIAIISLGTLTFTPAATASHTTVLASKVVIPTPVTVVEAAQVVPTPATSTSAPTSALAPSTSATPAFNASDPSTWPTCPAGQIVWAQDGQCHTSATTAVTPAAASTTSSVVSGCGDSYYANLVYMFESHCSLIAVNPSSGDYGIGQSGGGLSSACPDWQTDYACQNTFFTNYMSNRYGSWITAWQHELDYGWW